MSSWQNDPDLEVTFLAIDPSVPGLLAWAEGIPVLRTFLRESIYFLHLWRDLRQCGISHIFSASHWSFLATHAPARFFARLRGKKIIINYRSGEARTTCNASAPENLSFRGSIKSERPPAPLPDAGTNPY
jgi:hypothetical protein